MFVVKLAHLHHRGIATSTEAFYLFDRKHPVRCGLVFSDAEFQLGVFNDAFSAPFDGAWTGVAKFEYVFANRIPG
jgi:hypothetical protein